MTKEKNKTIILTITLSLICLILIGIFTFDVLKENGLIVDKETKQLMNEFDKYFKSKKRTVIYYASSGCGYCELQKPILETIAEDYDMDYLEIDSATLGLKQRQEILTKLDIEQATPTTVIVQNGKVIDVADGYQEGKEYVKFFVDNEIIPEDAVYSKEAYITFIDYDEYEDLIDDSNISVIVIAQSGCGACRMIKPALNKVAKEYNITINYLNLSEMTEEEYNNFSNSLKEIEYNDPDFVKDGSFGTPLTLIVKNRKVKDYISGSRTKSQLVRELERNGLISE